MSIVPSDVPQIGADDFARRFSLRAKSLAWFLGAGASASSGIPTAWDMTWDFKSKLYVSQRRVSPTAVADLSSSTIRDQLQAHIDSSGHLPSAGDPDEYAALFETAYPAEADRRNYIEGKISGAKPSYGHMAIATLMRGQLARLVWTTNFDPLLADACAKVYDATGPLSTVSLDAPDLASQLLEDERWPIEIKLHGDFRSRRLKNTSDELRDQDVRLRQVLLDSCGRFGLIVAGYSGRDSSIMDTLDDVLTKPSAFPAGLFWLRRGDDPVLPRVSQLLTNAADRGVEAALVHIDNFDELLRDLIRLIQGVDTTTLEAFASERQRWSPAPRPSGGRGWPVVRLNALPVTAPTVCRRVCCDVGGYAEMRTAVANAGVDLIVARVRAGVLAFGRDADVRAAFQSYTVSEFDLHTIETKRLRYDSGERGLLRDALTRAIATNRELDVSRRRNADLLAPTHPDAARWAPLRQLVGTTCGTTKQYDELRWREGVAIRLDWPVNRLWLLIEPRIVFDGLTQINKAAAADFARERVAKRYNRQLNDLIAFWTALLAGDGGELRTLRIGDGIDAVFNLSAQTGFSRRATV